MAIFKLALFSAAVFLYLNSTIAQGFGDCSEDPKMPWCYPNKIEVCMGYDPSVELVSSKDIYLALKRAKDDSNLKIPCLKSFSYSKGTLTLTTEIDGEKNIFQGGAGERTAYRFPYAWPPGTGTQPDTYPYNHNGKNYDLDIGTKTKYGEQGFVLRERRMDRPLKHGQIVHSIILQSTNREFIGLSIGTFKYTLPRAASLPNEGSFELLKQSSCGDFDASTEYFNAEWFEPQNTCDESNN